MSEQNNVSDLLDALAKVLLRCFVLGFLPLLIWFALLVLAGDWTYEIHSKWFSLTRHEFDVIHYCGSGLLKLCVFLLFLFPYIAIRLVLRKRNT